MLSELMLLMDIAKIIYANPGKGSFYLNVGFKFMTSAMAFLKMNRLLSNQAL